MSLKTIITASLMVLLLTACKKDAPKPSNPDYIVFGHFYGECMGEGCIEIFKLKEDKLLEDTNDLYPNSKDFYNGHYIQLSEQKFNATKELTSLFPPDLLNETKTVFGSPDAADGGGLYIEYNANGVRKFWLFDQMKGNVPSKYHAFMDKVNEKIQQLQ
ncbi:MAG TPA: hypothetical protein DIW47_09675 [Bacteroidetes bacterium]|nr:hypothetical protein [Bacteroidota bacterium]